MSYRREITTLGRGGSDTTAVALAAALGAECEIYSDVDGVYSADPRVVTDARRIDAIGYEEMQELAEHGAKVLNAQAVEWARKAGIVIHARATNGATSGDIKETRVVAGPTEAGNGERGAVAVTGTRSLMKLRGGSRALTILAEHGVAIRNAATGVIRFVRDDVPDWSRIQEQLIADGATLEEEGAVTVVGTMTGSSASFVARALELTREAGGFSDYDASPLRLTVYVAPDRVDHTVRALHSLLA